jgi:hypothetical protein
MLMPKRDETEVIKIIFRKKVKGPYSILHQQEVTEHSYTNASLDQRYAHLVIHLQMKITSKKNVSHGNVHIKK